MELNWTCEKIKIKNLAVLENNPRLIKEDKFSSLEDSVDELGIFRPLVVDFDCKTILAGNQRFRVLKDKFGEDHFVDCMIPSRKLSQKEKEKIVILDNAHYGEWDFNILANEFDFDTLEELNVDLKLPDIDSLDELDLDDDKDSDDENKKYILQVQFPNDMEMMDLHDDLASKGYMVKIL